MTTTAHKMHTMLTIWCATLSRDAVRITDEIKIDDESVLFLFEIANNGTVIKSAALYCALLDSYLTLSPPLNQGRPESADDDLASWDWDTIF